MKGSFATVARSLAAAVVLLAALTQPVASDLPKTRGWVALDTPHFAFYGNAGEQRTRRIAEDLERFREVLGRITKGFRFDETDRTTVFVFRNDAALAPYKLDGAGRPKNISGFFMERPFGDTIAFDASAYDRATRIVYHEYVHALLHRTFETLPLWLDEGLAEYYGTFRLRDGGTRAEVGHPIPHHLAQLSTRGSMPLDELFRTTIRSGAYNERERQGAFYAQSWLLVHYLASTEERRARLGQLLGRLKSGADPAAALELLMPDGKAALEASLAAYLVEVVRDGGRFVWFSLEDEAGRVESGSRRLERGAVLYRLGDLLVQRGPDHVDAARRHLLAAREAGGPNARILGSLAAVEELAGNDDEAARLHARAVEADPEDADLLAQRGLFVLRRFVATHRTPPEDAVPPAVLEARALLRRSVELKPDGVEALAGLGKTFLIGPGDKAEGLRALATANSLRPGRVDILHDLVCMLAETGRTGAAWTLIEDKLRPRVVDPGIVATAEGWVAETEIEAAWRHAESGDAPAAVETIRAALARASDPGARRRLGGLMTLFGEQGAPSRDTAAEGTADLSALDELLAPESRLLLERIREVSRLADEGKVDDALALLRRALDDCDEPRVCNALAAGIRRISDRAERVERVERFNSAIRLAGQGRRDEAVEILRDLAVEARRDEALRRRIEAALERLGAR